MWVDDEQGSENSNCGQSSSPCKTLSLALQKSSDHDLIKIRGQQFVDESIKMARNVTFQGIGDASILPRDNQVPIYEFEKSIEEDHLSITFLSLRVKGVPLLNYKSIDQSVTVVIDSCSFDDLDVKKGLIKTYIDLWYRREYHGFVTLDINNSTFSNMMAFSISPSSVVIGWGAFRIL